MGTCAKLVAALLAPGGRAAHRDALARPILLPMFLLPQKLARLYRSIFWRPSRAGLDFLFFFASC
jgi:hypothetical protein